jgi:hypothetical protein
VLTLSDSALIWSRVWIRRCLRISISHQYAELDENPACATSRNNRAVFKLLQVGLFGELLTNWKDDTSCVLVPALGDSNAVWCGYEVYRQRYDQGDSVQKWKTFGGVPYPPKVTKFTPSLPLDRRGQGYQSTCCVASMWYTVEVVTGSCVALKPSTQREADRSRPPRPLMMRPCQSVWQAVEGANMAANVRIKRSVV